MCLHVVPPRRRVRCDGLFEYIAERSVLEHIAKRSVRDGGFGAEAMRRHGAGIDLERRIALEVASAPVAPGSASEAAEPDR
jgi:hypothetical protein